MTTEELRAAAERRRQAIADSNSHDGGYPATNEGRRAALRDACALADAYIAELDPTPISNAGMESMGWKYEKGYYDTEGEWHTQGFVMWESDARWRFCHEDSGETRSPTTMGQLRTLLRLLKETER